jgi:hypothetical protein
MVYESVIWPNVIAFMNWGVLVGPSAETSLSVTKRNAIRVSIGRSHLFTSLNKQIEPAPKSPLRAK